MRNRDSLRLRPEPVYDQEPPSLLTLLIVVNLGAFFLQKFFAMPLADGELPAGHISHARLAAGEWWCVFTHLFTHHDLFHLLSNMLILWMAGRSVLKQLGNRNFAYLFFIGGWLGTGLELFAGAAGSDVAIVGASGSVLAIFAAFATLHPYYSITEPFRRWVSFSLPVQRVMFCFLFAEVLLDVLYRLPFAANLPGKGMSHLCHVGGLAFGWLYTRSLRPRRPQPDLQRVTPSRSRRVLDEEDLGEFPFVPVAQSLRSKNETERTPVIPVQQAEPMTDAEFIHDSVNPILEKLHERGITSLTEEEQRILKEAANRLGR